MKKFSILSCLTKALSNTMKYKTKASIKVIGAALALFFLCPVAFAGLPEPGVTLYGSATNMTTGNLINGGKLRLTITPPTGSPVVLNITMENLGAGRFSYRADLPFQTVFNPANFPGVETGALTLSPGALQLFATPTNYTLSAVYFSPSDTAMANPRPVTIGGGSSIALSTADRGRVIRLDMQVDTPVTSNEIVNYLLGYASNPNGLDINNNATVEIGDAVSSVNSGNR
jgi:hypothetical protein